MNRTLRYVDFDKVGEYQKDGWTIVPMGVHVHPVLDSRGYLMVKWELDDDECE